MLTIPPSARVYLSISPVDFRRQVRGLKKWVQIEMELDPFSNSYFFFLSKNKKSIKVLHFDGQGLCMYWKALSKGKFKWWEGIHDLSAKYLILHPTNGQVILMNGNTQQLKIPENWREIG